MQKILAKVIEEIKPTKEDEEVVKEIVREVKKKVRIRDAAVELGGSGAKGTWLKKNYEIDMYVGFNKKYKDRDISEILGKELRKKFSKVSRLYGSRDYYQIGYKNYTIEVVPIIRIRNAKEAINITDVSPFHAKWVKKHKLGDEIRLAKAFCKAQGCYGAESYIQGFSGYVMEILTIYYGSFVKLMKNAAKWKQKEYIDIEKHGKHLNKSKTQSPLIVIDPVQADRNAAAALGKKKYNKFIQTAESFLKKPGEHYFFEKEFSEEELKKNTKGKKLILIKIKPKEGKKDIVGAKFVKVFEHIRYKLAKNDFKVYDYSWDWNKKLHFWYVLDKKKLSKKRIHKGPLLTQKRHVEMFSKKNKKFRIFRKGNRIFAEKPRKYLEAETLIRDVLKERFTKKNIRSAQINQ